MQAQKSKLALLGSDIQEFECKSQSQQAAAEDERTHWSIQVALLTKHQTEAALAVEAACSEQSLHASVFAEKKRAFMEAQRQYDLDQRSDAANIQVLQDKERQLGSQMQSMTVALQQLESILKVEHQARQRNLEERRRQAAESGAEVVKMQTGLATSSATMRDQMKLKKERAALRVKEAEREALECVEEEAELDRALALHRL